MLISTDCRCNQADLPFKLHNVPLCFKAAFGSVWPTRWLPVQVSDAKWCTLLNKNHNWHEEKRKKKKIHSLAFLWFAGMLFQYLFDFHVLPKSLTNLPLRDLRTILFGRFLSHTFPRYFFLNFICMKIKLMFYLFLPSEIACRCPLGVMIYTYNWTKKKKKGLHLLARTLMKHSEMKFHTTSSWLVVSFSILKCFITSLFVTPLIHHCKIKNQRPPNLQNNGKIFVPDLSRYSHSFIYWTSLD